MPALTQPDGHHPLNAHYAELFRYDQWAQTTLIASVRHEAPNDEHCRALLGHVTGALATYLARVRGEPVERSLLRPDWSLARIDEEHQALIAGWLDALAHDDSERRIAYTSTIVGPIERSVGQMATTLHIHGAHHRGQVCAQLIACGAPAPSIDYIFWDDLPTKP